MGTVLVDQRGTRLEHRSGAMIVREPGQSPRSIPLNLLERVIVAGAAQIDSTLLTHLAERNIALLVMPARGFRRSAFLFSAGHGDAARRLYQYRMTLDKVQSTRWAQRFVALKIGGDIRLLRRALAQRSDRRRPLMKGIEELRQAIPRVRSAAGAATLRGLEGAASASFFGAYRELFPASLKFERRNRRPPRDPVNAALSLGYTLAHGDALRAVTRAGLDPLLGFLHEVTYNRESLACDFVEVARPRVEYMVWRLFAEQNLRVDQFSMDGDAVRLSKAGRATFFAAYEMQAAIHRHWFQRLAAVLAKACTVVDRGTTAPEETSSRG